MRFWVVAFAESVPVRLAALAVRMLGWLVVFSAMVIWWGPADTDANPSRAVLGLAVGVAVWAVGMLPRRLVHQLLATGLSSVRGKAKFAAGRSQGP